ASRLRRRRHRPRAWREPRRHDGEREAARRMSKGKPYPHERRLQRLAFVALAAAAVLSFIAIAQGRSRLFGADLPLAAPYGVAALGALLGVAAIVRRAASLVLAACAGLILGALPAALVEPGFLDYAVR